MIVGATSAIAKQCARQWAINSPSEIVLVGRSREKLEQVSSDLAVRAPNAVIRSMAADFSSPQQINSLVAEMFAQGAVDIALIAHGSLPDQDVCQSDLSACRDALEVNGLSPVLFAEAFALHMEKANAGTLAIIGSVAGDRGRKSNYVYGAAKGLVARYAQGLQHRLAKTGISVVLVKPGPTDTPMTAHLKQTGAKLADPEQVANDIVRGIATGKRIVYTPGIWALIMLVIRHLPHFIFKRMDV